jgi:ketosteroid isomerase-like protein
MSESNAELARRGYEAASRGDFEVVAGMFDDEVRLTANLTTFREGKAVEMVHYPNAADALAAVGL